MGASEEEMTKGIENMLGLPHLEDVLKEQEVDYENPEEPYKEVEQVEEETTSVTVSNTTSLLTMLQEKLANIEGTDHAKSMDMIFEETLEHSRLLMDLGHNVDERSRRGIFEIATSMYKNALDAKNSKRDAQLKLMKLLLDQQKQDFEKQKWLAERGEAVGTTNEAGVPIATATIVEDRNELVKKMRAAMKSEQEGADED